MRKKRVYRILSLFKKEELKRFRTFLISPLFDRNKSLLEFFELWERKVLGKKGEISPEDFLTGSKFSLSRLDKLCSQLLRKSIDFLALLEFRDSARIQMDCAATALEKRGAPPDEILRHEERQRRWLVDQKSSAEKERLVLQLNWRIAEAKAASRQTRILWKEDFRNLHELLDNYYYLQKLKLSSASANARHLFKHKDEPAASFLAFFRNSVDTTKLGHLARAYFFTVEMLTQDKSQPAFLNLTTLLQLESVDFGEQEARELYHYALNFCIRKSNQGEDLYKAYTGTLYRDLLDKGLLLTNDRLPSQTMKNIVVIHCRLGQLDWVESFLREYSDHLEISTHPATVTYNEAVLAFFRRNFRSAISKLKEVISHLKDDIFYELDARIYLWKSYYEFYDMLSMEEVDEMERMYDAFRVFIDRNKKLSEQHKIQYRNFIREFKRLHRIRNSQQAPQFRERLENLAQEFIEMENTTSKEWFLDKVKEMLAAISPV